MAHPEAFPEQSRGSSAMLSSSSRSGSSISRSALRKSQLSTIANMPISSSYPLTDSLGHEDDTALTPICSHSKPIHHFFGKTKREETPTTPKTSCSSAGPEERIFQTNGSLVPKQSQYSFPSNLESSKLLSYPPNNNEQHNNDRITSSNQTASILFQEGEKETRRNQPTNSLSLNISNIKQTSQHKNSRESLSDMSVGIIFVILGCNALYLWNALVDCIFSVESDVFPSARGISDTTTAVFDTFCFLGTATVVITGPFFESFTLCGCVATCLISLSLASIIQFSSSGVVYLLLAAMACTAGFTCSFLETSAYAYSSATRATANGSGWLSFGIGSSGVLSMLIWNVLSRLVFSETPSGIRRAIWVHMGIAAIISMAAFVSGLHYFCDLPSVQSDVSDGSESADNFNFGSTIESARSDKPENGLQELSLPNVSDSGMPISSFDSKRNFISRILCGKQQDHGPMSYQDCFLATWNWQLHLTLTTAVTSIIFPNICPYGFHETSLQVDFTTGLYQVSDFVGRYLPTLIQHDFSSLSIQILSVARLGIFFVAIAIMRLGTATGQSVFNALSFHSAVCILLGISNGWVTTECMIRLPRILSHPVDKGRAAAISSGLTMSAIVIVMWVSKLLKTELYH